MASNRVAWTAGRTAWTVLQAVKHANCIPAVLARMANVAAHPNFVPAWEYVVSVHRRAGNKEQEAAAQRALLKCRSAGVRSRDASHKSRQLRQKKR